MPPTERDALAAALTEHGLCILVGGDDVPPEAAKIAPNALIVRLARDSDPRLHLALTSLFLVHPEYARHVRRALSSLDGASAVELKARYMAAVYLQRWWRTRLRYYLGDYSLLPDLFSVELGLPAPNERYGKVGLVALAEWHSRQTAIPFNRLASYYKSADLVLGQLRTEAHPREFAATG